MQKRTLGNSGGDYTGWPGHMGVRWSGEWGWGPQDDQEFNRGHPPRH